MAAEVALLCQPQEERVGMKSAVSGLGLTLLQSLPNATAHLEAAVRGLKLSFISTVAVRIQLCNQDFCGQDAAMSS